jgi:hypothetical protein
MIMKNTLLVSLLFFLSTLPASAEQLCPGGVSHYKGTKPFLTYNFKGETLLFCGEITRVNEWKYEGSEYDIVNLKTLTTPLKFGIESSLIEIKNNKLLVYETILLPTGKKWEFETYPRYLYTPEIVNSKIQFKKTYVFKPPTLTSQQIEEIFVYYAKITKVKYANVELIGGLITAAMNGSKKAEELFLSLPKKLIIDGSIRKFYSDMKSCYDEYLRNKRT